MKRLNFNLGQRFSRLIVTGWRDGYYILKCDCGNLTSGKSSDLRRGFKQSCGCYGTLRRSESCKKRSTVHGKKGTAEYSIWQNMRARCLNKNHIAYKNYGGRGVSVCKRWDDFSAFLNDMGKRPARHTIERLDVNSGYSPKNCVWASYTQQARNRRDSYIVSYKGKRMHAAELAQELGKSLGWVKHRYKKV